MPSKQEQIDILEFLLPFADAVRITLWNKMRLEAKTDEEVDEWVAAHPEWPVINDQVHDARRWLQELRGENAG